MRIGLIARADNSGLGTLSREFAEHLKPEKVLIVSNGIYQIFPERYIPTKTRIIPDNGTITLQDMAWFFDGIDIILSFETFYNWGIVLMARRKGIKTALVTMFEMTQQYLPDYPDIFICPPKLDYEVFEKYQDKAKVVYLPIPMCTNHLVWKKRNKAELFIHTASHGGVNGRKGTQLLLDAMEFVQSDIRLRIYTWREFKTKDKRIDIVGVNFKNYWQCWQEGDVLVYPQDYNGICLPVMEALASGLGIISTDIYPFNEYLPKDLLFQPTAFYRTRAGQNLIEVDAAKISVLNIAKKIDEITNTNISKYSLCGKQWAEENSWNSLLPRYIKTLEDLCYNK